VKLFALNSTVGFLALITGTAAFAQHEGHDMSLPMPAEPAKPESAPAPAPTPDPHAAHDMSGMQMPDETTANAHAGHDMAMPEGMVMTKPGWRGVLGSYGMTREASGTSWQPDSSMHDGIHLASGDWTFMIHGNQELGRAQRADLRGQLGELLGRFEIALEQDDSAGQRMQQAFAVGILQSQRADIQHHRTERLQRDGHVLYASSTTTAHAMLRSCVNVT